MTKTAVTRVTRAYGSLFGMALGMALGAIIVIDGDTLEQDGVRWRLAGIDAPEIHRARCPEERRRGILGATRLIALIDERGGRLVPVSGKPQRDKYGRQLGALFIGDEPWAAIAVREGHAVAWDGKGRQPSWCGGTT